MRRSSSTWPVAVWLAAALLAVTCPAPVLAQVLGTWGPGEKPSPNFEVGGNPEAKHGSPDGGHIRSLTSAPGGMGYLRTQLPAGPYLGKRVRLSGFVKAEDVTGWAALSIRVDGPNGVWLANDLMEGRLIKGTTDWRKHDLVVDVPASATDIRLRMAMFGAGRTWVDGVTLDVVGPEVPLTDWPGRWTSTGSAPDDYEIGGNPAASHGSPDGGYVRSKTGATKESGGLGTWLVPSPYLAKRVRLSAFVRTENLERMAGLFMWVGGANNAMLGFDNMGDRPIKGTTDWRRYEAVVDVPSGTTNLAYGLLVDGGGAAWIDGVAVEAVGPEVPLTGQPEWFPTGTNPEDYEMGGDPGVAHGAAGGGYIRSKVEAPRTFGSWASTTPVGGFLGKRVRLSGYVRTEGAEKAAIWMRVDGPNNQLLAFDNMDNRPINGTTDWKKYDLVLDVAPQAVDIMCGIMLYGRGRVWIDGLAFEPVGADVPSTHIASPYTEYYEGRYAEAAKLFPERIARTPASFSYKLFHFLALHRSGQAKEAQAFLAGVAASLTDQKWAGPVVQFYAGRLSEDDVLKAAASADPKTDNEQRCEAYYYLAMAYHLKLGGVQADAAAAKVREYLEKCVATGVTNFVEYRAAQAELGRLKR